MSDDKATARVLVHARRASAPPHVEQSALNQARHFYSGADLVCLIPTKDRPNTLVQLLESLATQSIACGRVIIVATGQSVEGVVMRFRERLPVEYLHSEDPGQIHQRNLGLSRVDERTPLVAFFDDDIVLEPNALQEMLDLWNRVEPETAGVGFNIVNAPRDRASPLARLFFRDGLAPGRVLNSGYNTRIDGIGRDLRTQWLGGGYTVWRRDVLEKCHQPELKTRWAIGEDVRFSYPIGKRYPLYVCAAARARHSLVLDQAPSRVIYRYRGLKGALAAFYFASSHPELSRMACLGTLCARIMSQVVLGCIRLDGGALQMSFGQAQAVAICVRSMLGLANVRAALED